MDPVTIATLVVIGVIAAWREGVHRGAAQYRASRDTRVRAVTKARGGKPLPPPARRRVLTRHGAAYWAREALHGLPETRTGLATGWMAHQIAVDRGRTAQAGKTTERLKGRAEHLKAMAEHRKAQQQALKEINEALGRAPQPVRGRKAARAAAATVIPFPKDPVTPARDPLAGRGHGSTPAGGSPDGSVTPPVQGGPEGGHGGTPEGGNGTPFRVPPVPPPVTPSPQPAGSPRTSSWLHPDENPCELCRGSGYSKDGHDACPACRGWGGVAPVPSALPLAAPDDVCGACGKPGTEDDPLRRGARGPVHHAHLASRRQEYRAAVIQHRTPAPVAPGGGGMASAPPAAAQAPAATPIQGGAAPMGDASYDKAIKNATQQQKKAEAAAAEAERDRAAAEALADQMAALAVDTASMNEQLTLVDSLRQQEAGAKATIQAAAVVVAGLKSRHGGIHGAVQDAPVRAAESGFYQEG